MMPTLESGDMILVNKYNYGLRLPVLNTKIVPIGEPERGDVIVFRYPADEKIDYIKRVVGLPGDKIEYINKLTVSITMKPRCRSLISLSSSSVRRITVFSTIARPLPALIRFRFTTTPTLVIT